MSITKPRKNRLRLAFAPVIERLENRQMLSATLTPSKSLLVFNAVQKSSPSVTQTLTLTDSGTSILTLGPASIKVVNDPSSSYQSSSRFNLLNLSSAPATLSPGQSFGLQVSYSATAVELDSALLDITTNDSVNPLQQITLRGIGTKGLGGTNQPSLAEILRAYNIPTIVGEGPNDANAYTSSLYPNPPDASSQEVPLQRLVKAGAGPVSIQVLASFTASGFSKSYVLGTYTPGNGTATDQHELFYTPASQNQTTVVTPEGATTFDPGSSPFGFYFIQNEQAKGRVGYSEDALNTWDTTNPRKFRFFPLENPDGSVVPNAYVFATTEWNSPVGYDFTNIVAIVRNVKAAPGAPNGPVLGITNPTAIPGSSTIMFSRIQNQNTTVGDQFHDTNTISINNTGDEPLIVSSYTLSAGWELVNAPSFPLTVAAGTSVPLTIKFTVSSKPPASYNETDSSAYPNGGGEIGGSLILLSNDPNHASLKLPLAGWYQYHSENENEPSFQTIINLMAGYTTNINPTPVPTLAESLGTTSTPTYYGEEVVSAYWAAADPTQAVGVQQLDSFHAQGASSYLYWFAQGHSGSLNKLITTASDDGQTLFPYAYGTTTPATASFSTTLTFGFKVDSDEYSDDALNPTKDGGGHHFRFYPVRDSTGKLVPNTYIMTMDYDNAGTGANFDFQDNVYILTNLRPAAVPAAPVDFYVAGATAGVSLQWAPVTDSTLSGYNIFRSTSSTGTFTQLNSTPITTTSFFDSTAPANVTEYYQLQAIDASGAVSLAVTGNAAALTSSNVSPPAAPTGLTAAGAAGAITLAWSAVTDPTLAGYNIYRGTSSTGTFTLLNSTPTSATTYTDATAPAGVTEYYRVTAVDSASGLESGYAAASAAAQSAATNGLTSVDIGASLTGSTTVVTSNVDYNVTAGGPGIAANADGFRYLYAQQSGNFDMKVEVNSITVAGNFSTAGILARSTLDTTSPDIYMSVSPANYRFKWRSTVGGLNNVSAGAVTPAFPNAWVRLVRVGNTFTGYDSSDGIHWTQLYSVTQTMPTALYLGLAVASNNTTQTTTAALRNYGVTTEAPTALTATPAAGAVKLSWTASTDPALKGYNIYRSNSSTGTFALLNSTPVTATSYTDTPLSADVTLYYKVTAIDATSGIESTAAFANAAATVTAPVTNLTATGSVSTITLAWTASSDPTLKGYNVYRSTSSTGTFTLLNSTPITSTTYADTSVSAGTTEYYKVTAVDSVSGLESAAASTSATATAAVTAPVTNLTAVGGVNKIALSWTASTDPTLRGYNVYRSTSSNGTFALLTGTPITSTSYTDSSVTFGTTEYYKVTAVDSASGLESAAVSTSATATTTAAPGGLTATAAVNVIKLNWTASTDPTVAGYAVYRSTSSTGTFTRLNSTLVMGTSYTDTPPTTNVIYYYRVTAIDQGGAESAAVSTSAAALANLTSADIGASPSGSTTVITPGTSYSVTAGGPGVSVTVDGFRYLYAQQTGDFDVAMQVQSITVAGNYSTAGIMARASLDASAADVYMSASPANYRFKDRPTAGATTAIASGGTVSYPSVWVRLTRVGNLFTGYYSSDGIHWTQMSSITEALPSTVYLGIAVASNNTTATTTAVINHYGATGAA